MSIRVKPAIPKFSGPALLGRLLLPGAMRRWATKVALSLQPVEPDSLLNTSKHYPLDIELQPEDLLTRTISVPVKLRTNASKIAALDLLRAFPLQADQFTWQIRQLSRQPDTLIFEQWVIKTERLDDLLESVRTKGFNVRKVTVAGVPGLPPIADYSQQTDRPIMLWWGAAIASLLLTLTASAGLQYREHQKLAQATSETARTIDSLRSELVALASASEERSVAVANLDAATRTFLSSTNTLQLLSRVSDLLDDDTWAPEYKQSQNQISITVFSAQDAPRLIATLQQIPEVETVQLSSPVLFDRQSAQSRFSLTLDLVQK